MTDSKRQDKTEDVDLRLKSVLEFRFLVLEESEDVRWEFGRKSERRAGCKSTPSQRHQKSLTASTRGIKNLYDDFLTISEQFSFLHLIWICFIWTSVR